MEAIRAATLKRRRAHCLYEHAVDVGSSDARIANPLPAPAKLEATRIEVSPSALGWENGHVLDERACDHAPLIERYSIPSTPQGISLGVLGEGLVRPGVQKSRPRLFDPLHEDRAGRLPLGGRDRAGGPPGGQLCELFFQLTDVMAATLLG